MTRIHKIVHVLVPFTTQVACGAAGHSANAAYRHQVTCEQCKKTSFYKMLAVYQSGSKAAGLRSKRRRK